MKFGVTGFPPLTFRSLSMLIGLPVLGLALVLMKIPFRIPRSHWRELFTLAVFNMFIWHVLVILALPMLSSGRAAILGYTMPIFSAIWGVIWFNAPLRARQWLGVAAAGVGVLLLLWNELSHLSGQPVGVLMVLVAASTWAYGTQRLRHTPPQTGLPWQQRAANLEHAFGCKQAVAGRHIAVVDDVMTTGSSLQEVARTLKLAGASRVDNWVLARTPPARTSRNSLAAVATQTEQPEQASHAGRRAVPTGNPAQHRQCHPAVRQCWCETASGATAGLQSG
jgi:hypothetical protein